MEILASRIVLRPTDFERSLAFYRDSLGLAVAREYPGGTVFFAGQSLIEVAGHNRPDGATGEFPGALWLQVRDVYAVQEELRRRRVRIARHAREEPWGLHEMHIKDPDGTTVIVVQVPESHPLRRDSRG